MNKSISKVRYIVEQLFGILKRHYNFTRGGCRGLKKVNMGFKLESKSLQLKNW